MITEPYPPYDDENVNAVNAMLTALSELGLECKDQHTRMTPYRLVHYLAYWLRPPDDIRFTVFNNDDGIDQMVVIDPIPFWACCSHHMLPFFGTVHFGYIPSNKLVGLSMVPLLVQSVCSRPWLQETMTKHLADIFDERLTPVGLGVVTRATHTCQMLDLGGPNVPRMVFSEMRGAMRDKHEAREEFLTLIGR